MKLLRKTIRMHECKKMNECLKKTEKKNLIMLNDDFKTKKCRKKNKNINSPCLFSLQCHQH